MEEVVAAKIAEVARFEGPMPAHQAVSAIADLVDHLNILSDSYEADVASLVRIGATIVALSADMQGWQDCDFARLPSPR